MDAQNVGFAIGRQALFDNLARRGEFLGDLRDEGLGVKAGEALEELLVGESLRTFDMAEDMSSGYSGFVLSLMMGGNWGTTE